MVLLHPMSGVTGLHTLLIGGLIIHFIFIQKCCPSVMILTSLGFDNAIMEHIQIDYSTSSNQALLIDINMNITLLKHLFVGEAYCVFFCAKLRLAIRWQLEQPDSPTSGSPAVQNPECFTRDTPACFITTTQFGEGIILFQIKPSSDLNLLNILFHQYSSTCGKISVIFLMQSFTKFLINALTA